MKLQKVVLINYAPLLLLLPFSLVIGFYIFINLELLLLPENFIYFCVYILYVFIPLYFVIYKPRQDMGHEILDILSKFSLRFKRHFFAYFTIIVAFSVFFLYLASMHISTYLERDRWILVGDMPIIPVDMVILPRLAYALSFLVPIDIVVPLTNLPFILLWLAFLVYVNSEENSSWVPVFLVFTSTFLGGLLFLTQYATFEFPAAVISFIGLYGLWRKKISTGIFFLIIGSVLKNTGIFHFASAGLFIFIIFLEERTYKDFFDKLDFRLIGFLGIYWLLNYWGLYYQIFSLNGGLGYLVKPVSQEVFLLSPLSSFLRALTVSYTIIFFLGILGALLIKESRLFFLIAVGVLIFMRSLSRWADDAYAQIFVPGFSYFTLLCVVLLWKWFRTNWMRVFCSTLLLSIILFRLYGLLIEFPTGMSRFTSNFDEYIGKLARRFPEEARVYERGISIIPYLREKRGGDLDAIEFRPLTGSKEKIIYELSQPGCKLVITQKDLLDQTDITEEELFSMGYSGHPYVLEDRSGTFVSYSRNCNDWEYK